jgi:anti-sigma factor RsiW
VALFIGGYGLYQFYRAWSRKIRRHLSLTEVPAGTQRWVLGVSRFGVAARGVVFCLIGFFLARATLHHNPAQAGGVRESLRAVAHAGRWPFVVIALGLIAYGVYELVNARYRNIRVA